MTSRPQVIVRVRALHNKLVDTVYRLCLKPEDYEFYICDKTKLRLGKNRFHVLLAIRKLVKNSTVLKTTSTHVEQKVWFLSKDEVEEALQWIEKGGWITRRSETSTADDIRLTRIIKTLKAPNTINAVLSWFQHLSVLGFPLFVNREEHEWYRQSKADLKRRKKRTAVLRAIKGLVNNTMFLETTTEAVYEKVPFLKESEIDDILRDFEYDGLIYPAGHSRKGYIFSLTSLAVSREV